MGMSLGNHPIRYASAEKLINDWIFGKIRGTARCSDEGEIIVAHEDVMICGSTSRLLVARNREISRVFALSSGRIPGWRTVRYAVETVAECRAPRTDDAEYPFPVVRIHSFENWNPLRCSRHIAREKMMETFRAEADALLEEWENLAPDDHAGLSLKASAWEKLTGMLPHLDECVPPEFEERHVALHVKLRLLGWPAPRRIEFQL
jgi:hypothetical protein